MIISHKYKFIFIKTGKVGGTSLEIALSRFLDPQDVITTISWVDELDRYKRGFRTAQNFQKPASDLRLSEYPRWLRSKLLTRVKSGESQLRMSTRTPHRFRSHMKASDVKREVGDEIWEDYLKFSIERNPWDKMVSKFFWDPEKKKSEISFKDYLLAGGCASNYEYYSVNGLPAMDYMIRYENLENDLAVVSSRVGLPENVHHTMKTISAKSGYRKNLDYRDMYDEELKQMVAIHFGREIQLMNYQF